MKMNSEEIDDEGFDNEFEDVMLFDNFSVRLLPIGDTSEDEYDADEEVVFVFKYLGRGAEGSIKYSYREK